MKAINQFENVEYTILLAEGTSTDKFNMTANRIFNSGRKEGDDYEFIYSLENYFEQVMKMSVGDSIAFKTERNESWMSVIVRIK